MDRKGNLIINTVPEQKEFNVAPEVSVESALETADAFMATAEGLGQNAIQLIDSSNPDVVRQRIAHLNRAARLRGYGTGVMLLCVPELVERMTNPPAAE